MNIKINGKSAATDKTTLFALCRDLGFMQNEASVRIINGFQTNEDVSLNNGDEIVLIKKGEFPGGQELEAMLCARHTPGVYEKIKNARVAVAGLGGLGSNIALNLARTGVGTLHLIDFDAVEPSNLNRQQYFIRHLGMKKTQAIKELIGEINPFVTVISEEVKITQENCLEVFKDDRIICEAFDNPDSKAMLANTLLTGREDAFVVAASGMAGFGDANAIVTRRVSKRLFVCGDMKSEARQGMGLMAPRAAVCAGHQSNAALNIILGEFKDE